MATTILKALSQEGVHAVGAINSIHVDTLAHGAKCKEDIDNFTLVELAGFDADDNVAECQQLSDKANQVYLIATVEQRYMNEDIGHFYNATGEDARLVVLKSNYTRFEQSAYSKNTGLVTIVKGNVAHFDVATKNFIISDASSPHVDYATSSAQFLVVGDEEDTSGNFIKATVRLMCTKA